MASYRDWMLIDNPNELDEQQLKQAIKSMGNAANKRLKRMENRGINFGEDSGEGVTSGVKRFGIKGKDFQALKNEFKRVRNFLSNPQSSLTGMKKAFREFKKEIAKGITRKKAKRLTKKERKEYEKMQKQKKTSGISKERGLTQWEELQQWRETWNFYNKLVDEGYYTPTDYDSKQVRETIIAVIKYRNEYNLSYEETWRRVVEELRYDYEIKQSNNDSDISTSSFFSMGESD